MESKSFPVKKFFAALAIFIAVLIISYFAYSFGKAQNQTKIENEVRTPFYPSNENNTPVATDSSTTTKSKEAESLRQLTIEADLSGYITSSGDVINNKIVVGTTENKSVRGFVSFPFEKIPLGVTIQKASLRLYIQKLSPNIFSKLGALAVDEIIIGDSLDKEDYSKAAIFYKLYEIPKATRPDWVEIDVTKSVSSNFSQAYGVVQFRIHFEEEVPTDDLTVIIEDSKNSQGTGYLPQLVVAY